MKKGLTVSKVQAGSIAAEMEIEAGDIILEVDKQTVQDILDLQYHTADNEFTMVIEKKNHEIWELQIEKEPGETLGIELSAVGAEGVKKCANRCVFCFVRQLPPGLRASLYDRDDDYRLSLTQGSYITLSNLKAKDFERIKSLHVSPLYISVHAWDPAVRKKLMANPAAANLPEQIETLIQAGITLHTQIVLVPEYNDGAVLQETVEKLAAYYPAVQSIGIVPVGLTKFRENLPRLRPVSPAEAAAILDAGKGWQEEFKRKTGKNLVYFSDEFYVLSGRELPQAEEYDDFSQLENGIGMTAKFDAEIRSALHLLPGPERERAKPERKQAKPERERAKPERKVHIVTGTLAADFFRRWANELAEKTGVQLEVRPIVNHFFGPQITVAGLVTAQDIAGQLGNLAGDYFLISRVMLKADEDIFLDDHSVQWLAEKINGRPIIVDNNGISFLEAILGERIGGEEL